MGSEEETKSPPSRIPEKTRKPKKWGYSSASVPGAGKSLEAWSTYQKSLAAIWESLTGVSEGLMASHAAATAKGEDLQGQGNDQLGCHLQDLTDRIDELSRFTTSVRELIGRAEQTGRSDFSKEAIGRLVQQRQDDRSRQSASAESDRAQTRKATRRRVGESQGNQATHEGKDRAKHNEKS